MRAARRAGVALAVLALVAPASALAHRTIKRGNHGRAVKHLQHVLHVPVDGAFGPHTAHAVRAFQRAHGLTADGVVGPATWSALLRASAAHRTAHVRSGGGAVRTLQRRLGVAADGVFGPQTAAAVRRFQGAHGLTVDGVVGPATWGALGVPGSMPVLKQRHPHHGGGGGGLPHAVVLAIRGGNRINTYPYRYGGGHGTFHDTGYDCSGSVSYVLHHAHLLSTTMDSTQLESYGQPGPGRWITVYANAGHAYMVIAGRRFDTSGANPGRWQPNDRSSAGYVVRHPAGL